MKSFSLLILLFCGHFIFAQNSGDTSKQLLKQDSTHLRSYLSEKNLSDSISAVHPTQGIDHKKTSSLEKKNAAPSVATQNVDIVQEINAVLNYKINRIWRQDLYCLVCENFDPGIAA